MKLETDFDDEITDEELAKIESELMDLAGPFPLPPTPPSEQRMQSILQRAKLEALAAEAADFTRDGVTSGLKGVIDTLLALGEKPSPEDGDSPDKD
ncbi:MAG: hypothetical protein P1V20_07385 [Verrucomicrobiales bacterium]|nr:hypothetical protein [Verrucomicrobiales bacterium]